MREANLEERVKKLEDRVTSLEKRIIEFEHRKISSSTSTPEPAKKVTMSKRTRNQIATT